ncbi:DNA (cytosine-5-)-methyltransferase [Limnohabitans sp. T6-5]|uniref:DNA cytosine methyltransferase n=1 Tax=Limnohabitans sp. T6-5 TaxID=1100724 RepID=UPI000D36CEDD|nr:DNA cytosine methyltransferase [Limnohabitans sp. T6-5]PUE09439.1 DNA (cytosine-5-)-methyltransferase [Limnohabitans sp. T6-5]
MNFPEKLNTLLRPQTQGSPLVLDLFAGCGGLALGFEAHSFETLGFEMDKDCCASYRHNLSGDCINTKLDASYVFPKAQVVIGGPPCQPFSVGGHQNGIRDARDGFPSFISAIEQSQPDIWMFENVRGLMYKNKDYLDRIITELQNLDYIVEFRLLNAVNYGVPQNRERVIVVGHRGEFNYPTTIGERVTAGQALTALPEQTNTENKLLTSSMDTYVAKYEKASHCITPRDLHLDRPSRTVTCRNLAGATGDMHRIVLPNGARRRLTVREGARLQSFPDWFEFQGSETSAFNQVGNAVPPLLAYALAGSFREYLNSSLRLSSAEIRKRRHPTQLNLLAA